MLLCTDPASDSLKFTEGGSKLVPPLPMAHPFSAMMTMNKTTALWVLTLLETIWIMRVHN